MDALPADAEPFNGATPEVDGCVRLWAPNAIGPGPPFLYPPPGDMIQWEPLSRYPHEGLYSDDLWDEQSSKSGGPSQEGEWLGGSEGEFDSDFNMARSEASTRTISLP